MRNSYDAWQLENDRTQVLRPVVQERTCPDAKQRFGELSENDRTLAGLCPIGRDRTRPIASSTLLEVIGR